MENLGGLQETETTKGEETKVVSMEKEQKIRKAFHYWKVNGREYKLKLKASTIGKLENKYRKNILNLVDDMPPLSVMLTIIQAAMEPWEHGIDYQDIEKIYDKWTEEGGNQINLYAKVIMPLMAVSGFFTEKQAALILEELENA